MKRILKQIGRVFKPIFRYGTIGTYHWFIILSEIVLILSVVASIILECNKSDSVSSISYFENYAIGIACSDLIVLVTSIAQFISERNRRANVFYSSAVIISHFMYAFVQDNKNYGKDHSKQFAEGLLMHIRKYAADAHEKLYWFGIKKDALYKKLYDELNTMVYCLNSNPEMIYDLNYNSISEIIVDTNKFGEKIYHDKNGFLKNISLWVQLDANEEKRELKEAEATSTELKSKKVCESTEKEDEINREKPKLIFKYRALSSREDIVRFYDIIKRHRLFLPNVLQLNDPFEGKIDISAGNMGDFIRRAKDTDFSPTKIAKLNTRVLALSEDCFSPQLWAYYCTDYQGVCLCFSTEKSFSKICPVKYSETIEIGDGERVNGYKRVLELVKDSLLIKQKGWEYEYEWRMVIQTEEEDLIFEEEKIEGSFLQYEPDELVGVILGDNLEKDMKELIRTIVPTHVKMFEVHTGALSGKVKLFDYGYEYPNDGSRPDFFETMDELIARVGKI